jgi:hypothetical protein
MQPRNTEEAVIMGLTDVAAVAATFALAPSAKGAPAQVEVNRAAGQAFRDEIASALRQAGRDVPTEVYKKTPFGPRYIDIEVSQGGKVLGGVETKTGASRYTPAQRAKDGYLRDVKGYPVNVVRDK